MEPVPAPGPTAPLVALVVAGVLALLVGLGLSQRDTSSPSPTSSAPPNAGQAAPVRRLASTSTVPLLEPFQPDPALLARITSPRAGARLDTATPIRVEGAGARPGSVLRAIVTGEGQELGRVFLQQDEDGAFHGRVPIFPPSAPTRGRITIFDAPGGFAVAWQEVRLESELPVSVWSPVTPARAVAGRAFDVSGGTLPVVGEVTARLVTLDGRVVAAQTVSPTRTWLPWRIFQLHLTPPRITGGTRTELRLSWRRDADRPESPGPVLPVTIGRP